MILFAVLVNVSMYALGATILSGFGTIAAALYLLYCLGVEINVVRKSCVDCYYYGKWCAFGKGRVAPLLFKQGDGKRFTSRCMSWKELAPDMLVPLFPLIGGIALLIISFSWSIIAMLAALATLSFYGNYIVRSKIACKYCKQREIGCPAERFFNKKLT